MFSSICIEVFTPLSLRHRHRILRHCHRRRLLRLLRRRLPDSAPPPSRAAAMGQEPPQCPCPCGGTGLITLLDPAADGRRWSLCSCRSCGPVGNDGSRRCTILVDPIVMFWTGGLILCEDCWEYCSLKRRIEAVKRARKKRKMQEAFFCSAKTGDVERTSCGDRITVHCCPKFCLQFDTKRKAWELPT